MAKVKIDVDLEAATAIATAAQLKSNLAAAGVSMASMGTAAQKATIEFASLMARVVAMPQSFKQVEIATGSTKAATALLGQEVLKLSDAAKRMGIEAPPEFQRLAASLVETENSLRALEASEAAAAAEMKRFEREAVLKTEASLQALEASEKAAADELNRLAAEATAAKAALANSIAGQTITRYEDLRARIAEMPGAFKQVVAATGTTKAATALLGQEVLKLRDEARRMGIETPASFDRLAAGLSKTNTQAAPVAQTFKDLGAGAVALGNILSRALEKGLQMAVSGFRALVGEAKKWIEESDQGEQAVASLNSALTTAGIMTESTSRHYQDMAAALSATSRATKDELLPLMGEMIASTNLSGESVKRASQAALDLAARYGKTLPEAFNIVQQVANGNISILSKLNINIKETGIASYDASRGLEALEATVRGAAAAGLEGWTGTWIEATRALAETRQTMGDMLKNALEPMAERTAQSAINMQAFVEANKPLIVEQMAVAIKGLDGAFLAANVTLLGMLEGLALGRQAFAGFMGTLGNMAKGMEALLAGMIAVAHKTGKELPQAIYDARAGLEGFVAATKENSEQADKFKALIDQVALAMVKQGDASKDAAKGIKGVGDAYVDADSHVVAFERHRALVLEQERKEMEELSRARIDWAIQAAKALAEPVLKADEAFKTARQNLSSWTSASKEDFAAMSGAIVSSFKLTSDHWQNATATAALHRDRVNEAIQAYKDFGLQVPSELLRVKMNIDLVDQVLGSIPKRLQAAKQAMSDWATTTPETLSTYSEAIVDAFNKTKQEWGSVGAAASMHKQSVDEAVQKYTDFGRSAPLALLNIKRQVDENSAATTAANTVATDQYSALGNVITQTYGRVVTYAGEAAAGTARVAAMTESWRLELEKIQAITATRDISTEDKVSVDVTKGPGKDFVAGLVERSKEAKGPIANWLKSLAEAAKGGDLGMMKNIWSAISDQAKVLDKFSVAGGGELASFALNVAQLINTFERLASSAPGRAAGGPVSAGRMYMVGERGPEMFVPNRGGSIVPNGGGGGGGSVFGMPSADDIGAAVAKAMMQLGPKGKPWSGSGEDVWSDFQSSYYKGGQRGGVEGMLREIADLLRQGQRVSIDGREITTVVNDNTKRGNYDRRSG